MDLLNVDKSEYGEQYNDHLLEQWKTCVEMANSSSERRISTNSVYITINAAILAVVSFTLDHKSVLLSIVGIVVSILWLNSISSYKKLNSTKYKVINEIEKRLPSAPFAYEWSLLGDNKKYKRFTHVERVLPWIFIGLFAVAIIIPCGKWFLGLIYSCA